MNSFPRVSKIWIAHSTPGLTTHPASSSAFPSIVLYSGLLQNTRPFAGKCYQQQFPKTDQKWTQTVHQD
ncbi:hypothetical protein BST61_g10781 [Cercospora zeina]